MTACTQPGCTSTIVDNYCEVCGSPARADPFVPAAASAASPAPADAPGLTAAHREPGFPPKPKSGSLVTACTQPGCAGMIVDSYCDVCGSPAGAVPFVPAAASAASSAPADAPGLTAVPTPAPAHIDEEIPTQRIPRVEMPRQQVSPQEVADRGAADPGAVDAQKVDREKVDPAGEDTGKVVGEEELAEEPDGAQDYRTRVEQAQLPDDVRNAALCEVGKLEQNRDQSAEFGDIRSWLDTILDLPWSTETPDSIDIQGSPEVEATLRRLIEPIVADLEEGDTAESEPVVADLEEGDTAESEPVVADLEEGDTALGGSQDDDTVQMPAVLAVLSGGRHQRPQLPEQQVLEPEPIQTPAEKRRESLVLAATTLALLISAILFASSRDGGVTAQSVPTVTATATATASKPTSEPSNESTVPGGEGPTIQLENLADSARPFQTVRIEGMYRGGPDTLLQVQRWEAGKWLAFPAPTKTDQSGQFTTHVEFGQPGRYQLRVLDPNSGVTSKSFVLVIKG